MSRSGARLFLSAPVNALAEGIYEEETLVSSLLDEGDFGIGTFNGLEGEMAVLDGRAWQIGSDAVPRPASGELRTPFACVTSFRADTTETFDEQALRSLGQPELFPLLERLLPSPNMAYAVRVDGLFRDVHVRCIAPARSGEPLARAARRQKEYVRDELEGTLMGFFTPQFMSSLSVPGFHLHLLDRARSFGGHLMSAAPAHVTIELAHLPRLELALPQTLDYLSADLSTDRREELERAERKE